VSLCRGLALRIGFTVNPWISVGYLALLTAVGSIMATRLLTKRLVK
jgi:hypothetical protein